MNRIRWVMPIAVLLVAVSSRAGATTSTDRAQVPATIRTQTLTVTGTGVSLDRELSGARASFQALELRTQTLAVTGTGASVADVLERGRGVTCAVGSGPGLNLGVGEKSGPITGGRLQTDVVVSVVLPSSADPTTARIYRCSLVLSGKLGGSDYVFLDDRRPGFPSRLRLP